MKKLSSNVIENFNHQWKLIRDIALVEESINDKWLPICKGDKVGNGMEDCALCGEYYLRCDSIGFKGHVCPISASTGECVCDGTPYVASAEGWFKLVWLPSRFELKQQAYAELFYLHDLADSLRDQLKELQDECI